MESKQDRRQSFIWISMGLSILLNCPITKLAETTYGWQECNFQVHFFLHFQSSVLLLSGQCCCSVYWCVLFTFSLILINWIGETERSSHLIFWMRFVALLLSFLSRRFLSQNLIRFVKIYLSSPELSTFLLSECVF